MTGDADGYTALSGHGETESGVTLSERLERARTERLIAAGKLPSEAALRPEPGGRQATSSAGSAIEPQAEPQPVWDPIEIEVQSTTLRPVSDAPSTFLATAPDSETHLCPNCNAEGRVDMVDLVGHRLHVTCPNCLAMWQVHTEDAEQRR